MVLWDTSPPSSQSAGCLSEGILSCPSNSSLDFWACCMESTTSLNSVVYNEMHVKEKKQTWIVVIFCLAGLHRRLQLQWVMLFYFFFFFFFFLRFRATAQQHQIQAVSVIYSRTDGNVRSLTHWARTGIEPTTSWFLVSFFSKVPGRELWVMLFLSFGDNFTGGHYILVLCLLYTLNLS